MDCLFNKFIPKSTKDMIVIRPYGKTFVNGMAQTFSYEEYDEELLKNILTRREYDSLIEEINNPIFSVYPCIGCQIFAYCCCICTAGLSCIVPYFQVKEAERAAKRKIDYLNQKIRNKNIKLQIKVENQTSYIIMYLPNHEIWSKNKISKEDAQ